MHGVQKRNLQLEKKTLLLSKQILKFLAIIHPSSFQNLPLVYSFSSELHDVNFT